MSWIASTSLPITSAVICASSATGMSLVPAQTTAILPLPRTVWSRQTRMAPESGRYSASAQLAPVTTAAVSRSARVISTFGAFSSSLSAIASTWSRRLALGEDHFRHAVAQRAMMVHLGESQVFERHVPHARESRLDIDRAFPHLLEQLPQLIFLHTILGYQLWPVSSRRQSQTRPGRAGRLRSKQLG